MSNPVNAAALRLGQRLNEMDSIVQQLKVAEAEAIEARHEANVREWKAFLSATGAMDLRKVTARLEVEAFTFAADNAEAKVRHLLRSMRLAEKRVDAGRTYSADVRAELATLGRDGAA